MRFASTLARAAFVLLPLAAMRLAAASTAPVTPEASPEARALLQLLYDVSGHHTFTGQHNYPNTKDHNSQFAAKYLGKSPVIFGTDMGHAKAGDSDSYLARPDIVQECIRQHQLGSIVAICWHAVPPTADEPVTFRQLPGSDPQALKSVQGQLLDEQFRDVLTPGTKLHEKWEAQVDAIAGFLKQLQDAHVPVLWRPYHEMNGDWFWWGGRGGDTAALYRMIFDRFVHHHHLKNLVWVWSMDRVSKPGMEHEKYFPGLEYADVLALDVYGKDFAQSYYESLERLSQGKPLALAEVGNPPSREILAQQPKWTFYMTWAGMVRNTPKTRYQALFSDPRVVNRDDPIYALLTAGYRRACGLDPLPTTAAEGNFTGHWVIDEDRSEFGRSGAASAPARLDVVHDGDSLTIRSTRILEYADDQVTEEKFTIGGPEARSEFMNSPRVTTVKRAPDHRLSFASVLAPRWAAPGAKVNVNETWQLADGGRSLVIESEAALPSGTQRTKQVFTRQE